jgi:hypothetical protein
MRVVSSQLHAFPSTVLAQGGECTCRPAMGRSDGTTSSCAHVFRPAWRRAIFYTQRYRTTFPYFVSTSSIFIQHSAIRAIGVSILSCAGGHPDREQDLVSAPEVTQRCNEHNGRMVREFPVLFGVPGRITHMCDTAMTEAEILHAVALGVDDIALATSHPGPRNQTTALSWRSCLRSRRCL